MDWMLLLTGLGIFFARIIDVSLGTIRTLAIVQGRTWMAFFLGLVEVSVWLLVLTTVLNRIMCEPVLAVFYALGFSAGNAVGILIERRLAMGFSILHVITSERADEMVRLLRDAGHSVTTFAGEGRNGPVTEIYAACDRKKVKKVLKIVQEIIPTVFYTVQSAGTVSHLVRPAAVPLTGWRGIMKKK